MRYKWWVVGALTLALLTLCAGIIAVSWFSIARLRASGVDWQFFSADTISAEADEEQRFAASGPATLTVENSAGNVTVTGGEGEEVVVHAHKTAWGSSQADAEAALSGLRVVMTQSGDSVTVRVEQPSKVVIAGSSRTDTVDFTITVPRETAVTVATSFGGVALSGTSGNADLETDFGDIDAADVSGDLLASTNSGEITTRRIQAETGKLDLHSDFGNVTLEDAAVGGVQVDSNSGAIRLARVEAGGDVTLTGEFGKIEFEGGRAASLSVETNSGSVSLTGLTVDGEAKAHSDFGAVTLEQVSAESYDLSSNSGAITVEGASGSVKARTDFGDVEVRGGENVTLALKTNSGSVTFSGSLGDGPHTLETAFGGVRLTLPKDAAVTFDLKTDSGKIKSDFPVTISGEIENDHWRGTINGGGVRLTASTNSGDISLDILNP